VKTINLLRAGNKVFIKYQAQGGLLTPTLLAYALASAYLCKEEIFCITSKGSM